MIERTSVRWFRLAASRSALAVALTVFTYGMLSASAPGPEWGPGSSITHLTASMVLGLLCRLSTASERRGAWMVVAVALFATLAELAQVWIPTREASLLDLSAGLTGLAAGYLLGRLACAVLKAWEVGPD